MKQLYTENSNWKLQSTNKGKIRRKSINKKAASSAVWCCVPLLSVRYFSTYGRNLSIREGVATLKVNMAGVLEAVEPIQSHGLQRAKRSQIRQQIRSIFTVQIDLVGAKLQMFNIRDLMTRNAILFHLGDDPFTPGGLGVFFENEAFRTRHEVTSKAPIKRCMIVDDS